MTSANITQFMSIFRYINSNYAIRLNWLGSQSFAAGWLFYYICNEYKKWKILRVTIKYSEQVQRIRGSYTYCIIDNLRYHSALSSLLVSLGTLTKRLNTYNCYTLQYSLKIHEYKIITDTVLIYSIL